VVLAYGNHCPKLNLTLSIARTSHEDYECDG